MNGDFLKVALGSTREIPHVDQKPSRDELTQRAERAHHEKDQSGAACLPANGGAGSVGRREEWKTRGLLMSFCTEILKC